jgi:peptidoglycan/LPS O-acetylase OafA/YrhL
MFAKYIGDGFNFQAKDGIWYYIWPPAQMPDFALGCVAAAMAQRCDRSGCWAWATDQSIERRAVGATGACAPTNDCAVASAQPLCAIAWRGLLADIAVVIIVLSVFCCPFSGFREGWDSLFDHGLAPFYALFLFGSSVNGGVEGWAARLLRHDSLVSLGQYSFEVYLFQWPVHEAFVALGDITRFSSMRKPNSEGFFLFFMSLWVIAGVYSENIETPLANWLRDVSDRDGNFLTESEYAASEAVLDARLEGSVRGVALAEADTACGVDQADRPGAIGRLGQGV